eukprot:Selendium_serpulae@DN6208_c0_g1_i3.p1
MLARFSGRKKNMRSILGTLSRASPKTHRRLPQHFGARFVSNEARPVYLDYQATTPVDPRVLDKMMPFYTSMFGNPHSRSHCYGWEAEGSVNTAREEVAALIGASSKEIVLTSGATESNNAAVKGVAGFYGSSGKKHIITSQIEHKCVLACCRSLQQSGWDVTYLPVGVDGIISLDQLEKSIRPDTALVSIMHVNNEIGVVQPLHEIGEICKKHNVLFHSDAAQSVGKIPVNVKDMNLGLVSISGHKIYGPKGVGALYVRSKPRVRITPIIEGGGQERGMRSGTIPTPLAVGLGEACRVARNEMENDRVHVERLSHRLWSKLRSELSGVTLNGSKDKRYYGNLNLSFAYVEGESLLMSLPGVAVSSGSACTSASLEPSYVLRAIGVDEELAHTSIRFGIGRFSTETEVDECAKAVLEEVTRLRNMSPLAEESASSCLWT